MNNPLQQELIELNIIDEQSIVPYFPRVRDREDVAVLQCTKSGVLFLNSTQHIAQSYYQDKPGTTYWNNKGREEALKETRTDDERRFHQFKQLIENKKYADVGCGLGGVLELMTSVSGKCYGVELQKEIRDLLNNNGFNVVSGLQDLETDFNIITMFHVFEHIVSPLSFLNTLKTKLKSGGKLIIEVPHANDTLLKSLNLDSFKSFTLWSEHLILHTKTSLKSYLEHAGFVNIDVKGFQRFPLSNHLYWLKEGKPGGQHVFSKFNNDELNLAYENLLANIDETDTIIAIAEKP